MFKQKLKKGDKVSLQSLSGGMAGDKLFLHKYKIGAKKINELNMTPIPSKHSLLGIDFILNNPQKRAEDLMEAYENKEIKMVIANIGGVDSSKIIPYLNSEVIKKNPKPILGYSDITSLHLYLYSLGIQTYYGPAVLDGFAENVEMHKITKDSVKKVVFTNEHQEIVSANEWTSEFLDWSNKSFNNIKRKMNKERHGHIFMNFEKDISGILLGGNLDTIVSIKDKPWFPKISEWENTVIFLETSEQKMEPQEFEKALNLLKEEIKVSKALIFGKPKDEKYFEEYLSIITNMINKPVIFNLNFGHTAPNLTIPYGGTINVSAKNKLIKISK